MKELIYAQIASTSTDHTWNFTEIITPETMPVPLLGISSLNHNVSYLLMSDIMCFSQNEANSLFQATHKHSATPQRREGANYWLQPQQNKLGNTEMLAGEGGSGWWRQSVNIRWMCCRSAVSLFPREVPSFPQKTHTHTNTLHLQFSYSRRNCLIQFVLNKCTTVFWSKQFNK